MNQLVAEVIRRALLDLLEDIGGEHNDQELTLLLNQLGHRVARRNVAEQLAWLAGQQLVKYEEIMPYHVASIRPDGRDVAQGLLTVSGVSRHKTGE